LILIGANPITSFDDTSTEALIANNMYEDVARAALCNTRWRFASNQSELNLLTDTPTGRFDRAHQLPSDLLMLHTLTVNDNILTYSIYGDKVFSDATVADKVIADYTFRANEIDWPSYFTLAVEYELASVFASSIARDEKLAELMSVKANQYMAKGRNLDSQQQTTRKLVVNRFKTTRNS
jgi:hypothetical protein